MEVGIHACLVSPFNFISTFICLPVFETEIHSPGWPQAPYVARNDLELLILLPPTPQSEEYGYISPSAVFAMLGTEPRPSYWVLGRHPVN